MRLLPSFLLVFAFLLVPPPAGAEDNVASLALPKKERKAYRVVASSKASLRTEGNLDLGTRSDDSESGMAVDSRAGLYFYPAKNLTAFIEGRALLNEGIATRQDEDGEKNFGASFAELRQAWTEYKNLFGTPLAVKAGRQRFREDYGLWWNRDTDALRLSWRGKPDTAFIAASYNLDNYRIGEDDEFRQEDRDRLRFFGEYSHALSPAHKIEARFLYEKDRSGFPSVGSVINANDRDDEDADLLWAGLRSAGTAEMTHAHLRYRLDGVMVGGEETLADTVPGPGGAQRTVSGRRNRNVMGWAFDGQVQAQFKDAILSPTLTLGYAFGSGEDKATGTDNAFRQSGMESNNSRLIDDRTMNPMRHYGEVLRPELSNIHILKAGADIPVFNASHAGFMYFSYWRDEKAARLRTADISAPLNGNNNHIGQALDLYVDVPLGQEMNLPSSTLQSLSSRIILGGFKAGEAYGAADDEYAWRGTAELRIRF